MIIYTDACQLRICLLVLANLFCKAISSLGEQWAAYALASIIARNRCFSSRFTAPSQPAADASPNGDAA